MALEVVFSLFHTAKITKNHENSHTHTKMELSEKPQFMHDIFFWKMIFISVVEFLKVWTSVFLFIPILSSFIPIIFWFGFVSVTLCCHAMLVQSMTQSVWTRQGQGGPEGWALGRPARSALLQCLEKAADVAGAVPNLDPQLAAYLGTKVLCCVEKWAETICLARFSRFCLICLRSERLAGMGVCSAHRMQR